MANALSYDKWNVIDGVSSDDDESKGAARPLLAGGKSHAQHQADEAMYEAFKQRFKEHFKGRAPLRQRKLLARFVAMQHRYAEPSNTFRYADIIGIVTQRHEELMEPSCVSLLCDLQKALLKQAQPEGGAPEDAAARAHAQIAMEAINTLEAVQRHQPVTALFEKLCSPSNSPAARALYERYAQLAFAKVALMRSVFGDDETLRDAERDFLGEGPPKAAGGGGAGCESAAVVAVFIALLLALGWGLARLLQGVL
eukprot:CAMPEP_0185351264 /NCGR_PEP_ID=MMETSP1364-20130426/3330_1 /TAXON_ID=38817 /ORGANISM="Gephyrocapsa oceanica, Strain RCC1303" /LENGTH=253 /DNA_ID=CAMNT_0027950807 /DNA_START=62 /DNA_END=823 /DNA_ORIENTATION=-